MPLFMQHVELSHTLQSVNDLDGKESERALLYVSESRSVVGTASAGSGAPRR